MNPFKAILNITEVENEYSGKIISAEELTATLEKSIAKKPVAIHYDYACCPNCRIEIDMLNWCFIKYCMNYGQKIDWSDFHETD